LRLGLQAGSRVYVKELRTTDSVKAQKPRRSASLSRQRAFQERLHLQNLARYARVQSAVDVDGAVHLVFEATEATAMELRDLLSRAPSAALGSGARPLRAFTRDLGRTLLRELAEELQTYHDDGYALRRLQLNGVWIDAPTSGDSIRAFLRGDIQGDDHLRAFFTDFTSARPMEAAVNTRGIRRQALKDVFLLGVAVAQLYSHSAETDPFDVLFGRDTDAARRLLGSFEAWRSNVVANQLDTPNAWSGLFGRLFAPVHAVDPALCTLLLTRVLAPDSARPTAGDLATAVPGPSAGLPQLGEELRRFMRRHSGREALFETLGKA
jgi:hypothetical protein